jgi:hypothetical protein
LGLFLFLFFSPIVFSLLVVGGGGSGRSSGVDKRLDERAHPVDVCREGGGGDPRTSSGPVALTSSKRCEVDGGVEAEAVALTSSKCCEVNGGVEAEEVE